MFAHKMALALCFAYRYILSLQDPRRQPIMLNSRILRKTEYVQLLAVRAFDAVPLCSYYAQFSVHEALIAIDELSYTSDCNATKNRPGILSSRVGEATRIGCRVPENLLLLPGGVAAKR
ncbi:hypothetical protein V1521DRAFT_432731 [Lipomyces starkeyi]